MGAVVLFSPKGSSKCMRLWNNYCSQNAMCSGLYSASKCIAALLPGFGWNGQSQATNTASPRMLEAQSCVVKMVSWCCFLMWMLKCLFKAKSWATPFDFQSYEVKQRQQFDFTSCLPSKSWLTTLIFWHSFDAPSPQHRVVLLPLPPLNKSLGWGEQVRIECA